MATPRVMTLLSVHKVNTFVLQAFMTVLLSAFVTPQYDIGLCRPPLIKTVFNSSVTLEMMLDEDYTVLFTSGLKQYKNVECARFGYRRTEARHIHEFFSYVETDQVRQQIPFPIFEVMPGKFMVELTSKEISFHYIAYKVDGVLLLYWCKHIKFVDNNYDNNIWMIAAKTSQVDTEATQKAVLQMLYHEDYRSLIDNDLDVVHRPDHSPKYLELRPCRQSTGEEALHLVNGYY